MGVRYGFGIVSLLVSSRLRRAKFSIFFYSLFGERVVFISFGEGFSYLFLMVFAGWMVD